MSSSLYEKIARRESGRCERTISKGRFGDRSGLFHGSRARSESSTGERVFEEVFDFAKQKRLPVGINVESISIRKSEIEASVALFEALQSKISR